MNIKTAAELKAAIALLEVDVTVKKKILTDQYHATVDSLRPSTIIKNGFQKLKEGFENMMESGDLAEKIIGTSVGFGAGVLTKKILVGKSTNIFKRILGTVIEVAVTNAVVKNSEGIKVKGLDLWRKFTNNHDHQSNKIKS